MNISHAAKLSGLPKKTIRYYEDIGLVKATARTQAGYRDYDDRAVRNLTFVRRSRDFGFSIEECRELLALYSDRNRSSSDVKNLAQKRLTQIEDKQRELELLRVELSSLVTACNGDDRPDCPILNHLA